MSRQQIYMAEPLPGTEKGSPSRAEASLAGKGEGPSALMGRNPRHTRQRRNTRSFRRSKQPLAGPKPGAVISFNPDKYPARQGDNIPTFHG